ncbi:MAG TPA: low temperature requirement protein A [Micromonosporaceae bacterium]|nr:low temperature requirement protein A [Micromonosporaceae bacterium]
MRDFAGKPAPAPVWYRPMLARDREEVHRTATPLELFFDLCFVVAVAYAADGLHHDLAEGHIRHGLLSYPMVFFAIWWAWMNFTWFASAYDPDDDLYRLTTLVQIAGALVLAAGVPQAFTDGDYRVTTYGYAVMRLAMVTQWLRVARSDRERRPAAIRFAIGVTAVQIGWLGRLALPEGWGARAFAVLVVAELAVPLWAERAAPTTWNRRHIAERYGLFTIIMLGESILATALAVQSAIGSGHAMTDLLAVAGSGAVIVFGMWWLYFDRPVDHLLTSLRVGFLFGYGHYVVFACAAAVGAGLAVAVDYVTHSAPVSAVAAGYATAVPVAGYLVTVWALHVYPQQRGLTTAAFPVTAILVLCAPLTPAPVPVIAVLMVALVAATVVTSRSSPGAASEPGD